MGFLDKVKNMFIEEIEEDEPVKKEVIQVEIPSPKPVLEEPSVEKVEKIEQPVIEKREEKFVFPVYFDDKDFEKIEKKEEIKVQPKPELKSSPQPLREAYGIKKEEKIEKKNFTPTPIISPVYGVLDKNYRKEEIKTRKKVSSYEYRGNEKVDIDDVRNKAYGTLENELEDNLFKKTSILFNDEVEENDNSINLFEEPRHGKVDFEEDNLEDNITLEALNREYEEKSESSYVNELNDSDLFNLIDSMYEKRDGE